LIKKMKKSSDDPQLRKGTVLLSETLPLHEVARLRQIFAGIDGVEGLSIPDQIKHLEQKTKRWKVKHRAPRKRAKVAGAEGGGGGGGAVESVVAPEAAAIAAAAVTAAAAAVAAASALAPVVR
jgi:hypothetical protein